MPVYASAESERFEAHGSRFESFVRSDRGGSSLCAWRLEIAPGLAGVAHRPSHEEVILMLGGNATVTLDGVRETISAGTVVHVLPGSELTLDGGPDGASAWVTTTPGLTARIGATVLTPPWAQ